MREIDLIDGVGEIAANYDAMICDAWGVIHDGVRVFDGVEQALMRFRQTRGPVAIVTNAPKPSSIIPAQLDAIGLSRDAYDVIVSSGDVTRAELGKRAGQRAFRIGWESDGVLFDGASVIASEIDDADFIICTGLFQDGPREPAGYRDMLAGAARRGVAMICANPDIVVRWRGRLEWCAGAIAREYETLGGSVVYAGKPYPEIYAIALDKLSGIARRPLARARVLAIGDGPSTDILGAERNGLDSVFIGHDKGVHDGPATLEGMKAAIAEAGAFSRYAATGLRW